MPSERTRALLFDIDGTLITTGGAGARAWRAAFSELHGVALDIAQVTESGMTDPEVGRAALRSVLDREPSGAELGRALGQYLGHLSETVESSPGYRVMPGVAELMPRLVTEGCLVGITSGNLEAAAHIKLARGRLNRFFSFGGYGSDAAERVELTRRAIERAVLVSGDTLAVDACIAIGDTPRDVEAGHGAGIQVVGVATGEYDAERLRAAGADQVIETLREEIEL